MAKLNIAERRLPQDGRIKLAIRGKEIDFRVSTVPTMHGESVVMRILDRGGAVFDFAVLGFDDAVLKPYLEMLERPNGILLVTGPTGSGKTTTLYTALLRLNTPDTKILTVEDPIEYQLDGVNQVQVKPQIGLTFASVLRSLLRQDPDIIMIGEIRDLETAQIAVQAALTGHLVLSTLHTNSAAGDGHPAARHGAGGLPARLDAERHHGAAAGAHALCRIAASPIPALAEISPANGRLTLRRRRGRSALPRRSVARAAAAPAISGGPAIAEMLVMTDEYPQADPAPRRRRRDPARRRRGRHADAVRGRHAQGGPRRDLARGGVCG